jgi:hypothetical protein
MDGKFQRALGKSHLIARCYFHAERRGGGYKLLGIIIKTEESTGPERILSGVLSRIIRCKVLKRMHLE